ncbi:hypothetical protein [Skermanella sp. TT6]|uniref:hypothetical protein n=1 Tax=Skermanella cutis TaxID=2775420 RepID=UPI001FFFC702|nr:hypothetical protein [Skermanella sp. TT6]
MTLIMVPGSALLIAAWMVLSGEPSEPLPELLPLLETQMTLEGLNPEKISATLRAVGILDSLYLCRVSWRSFGCIT